MAGKHKKGTKSYDRWIDSYRKKKPVKTVNANLDARKPHKTVKQDHDVEKSASFASMAPSVKTREFRAGQRESLRNGSAPGTREPGIKSGYGGMGGGGFGKSTLPQSTPSEDNVRNETLGDAPPGVGAPNPEFIDNRGDKEKETGNAYAEKSVGSDNDDSLDSAEFANTQTELKKFLGGLPSVAAKQVRKKEGPAYSFDNDGSGDAPVQKSYNMDRVRLAWDLHQVANKRPHFNLKKSDPVKGTLEVGGVEICVEWPKGSIRRYKENGIMKDGKLMLASYGYVPDTITSDGEELDVYVGPNKRSERVFLLLQKPTPWDISQNNLEPEEKYMLGFDDMEEARKAFIGSMPAKFFKNIREVDWSYFVHRVDKANKKLAKHTESESCGYLYKKTLDKYDRSQSANRVVNRDNVASATSVDADLLNLVKSLNGFVDRINKIPRIVIKLD